MKLGRWIGIFREITNTEEEDAVAVNEGRQRGNQPIEIYIETTNQIRTEKDRILDFLNGDIDDDAYFNRMSTYLGKQ